MGQLPCEEMFYGRAVGHKAKTHLEKHGELLFTINLRGC